MNSGLSILIYILFAGLIIGEASLFHALKSESGTTASVAPISSQSVITRVKLPTSTPFVNANVLTPSLPTVTPTAIILPTNTPETVIVPTQTPQIPTTTNTPTVTIMLPPNTLTPTTVLIPTKTPVPTYTPTPLPTPTPTRTPLPPTPTAVPQVITLSTTQYLLDDPVQFILSRKVDSTDQWVGIFHPESINTAFIGYLKLNQGEGFSTLMMSSPKRISGQGAGTYELRLIETVESGYRLIAKSVKLEYLERPTATPTNTPTATPSPTPTPTSTPTNTPTPTPIIDIGGGPVTLGNTYTGLIDPYGDIDDWTLSLPEGGEISVAMIQYSGTSLDPYLKITSLSGEILAQDNDSLNSVDAQILGLTLPSGDYLIRCSGALTGPYTLIIGSGPTLP